MDKWIYNAVANNIRKGKIAESEAEIYEYGYTLMVEKMIIFTISVVIALLLDAIWEVLALCTTFIPLRVYSGGYHARSRWGCIVLSGTFVALGIVGIRVLSQFISVPAYLVVEAACIFITMRFAPVAVRQKPMAVSEKNYYRKKVMFIVCAELLAGLIFIYFGFPMVMTSVLLSNVCNVFSVSGEIFLKYKLIRKCLVHGVVQNGRMDT